MKHGCMEKPIRFLAGVSFALLAFCILFSESASADTEPTPLPTETLPETEPMETTLLPAPTPTSEPMPSLIPTPMPEPQLSEDVVRAIAEIERNREPNAISAEEIDRILTTLPEDISPCACGRCHQGVFLARQGQV